MSEELQLNLLGSPQILKGGRPLTGFATSKAQALLFYLAVMAQREGEPKIAHSRDTLATLLWGEMPDVNARRNLRAVLPDLRRLLGDYLHIDRQSITFDTDPPFWLDVHQFQRELTEPSALVRWQTAVDLYRGEFLSGFTVTNAPDFDLWVLEQRQKLHLTAVEALLTLIDAYKKVGNTAAALANNRRLLALEPWSEPVHRQQMLLLAQSGQRTAALAQYDACRAILKDEFGVEPLAETIALYEQIRTGAFQPLEKSTFAALEGAAVKTAAPAEPPSATISRAGQTAVIVNQRDLPPDVPFFGRAEALAQLQAWVESGTCRLIGVYAIGGQGKTTLAAKLVRRLMVAADAKAEADAENVSSVQAFAWQSLLNAPPLTEVLQRWIYTLSAHTVDKLPDSLDRQFDLLLDFLQRQPTLLVLDNFESVLQAEGQNGRYRPGYEPYGQLLRRLAEANHYGCLLLTSRERPRGIPRLEKELKTVRSLSLAGLDSSAGGRMMQMRGLKVTETHINALTAQYSGNPLALKLAADTIQDIFGGDAALFLQTETAVFDDIRNVLDQQFSRLSSIEQRLLIWLAIVREAIPFTQLRPLLAQPPAPRLLLESVRSLLRRSLVEKPGAGLTLQNVVMEYATELLIENIVRELLEAETGEQLAQGWLNQYALLLVRSKVYVRASQRRQLLQPVAERLTAHLGFEQAVQQLKKRIKQLQQLPPTPGYAAANVLHLLLQLGANLRGMDFSRLRFEQLYLRGVNLRQVDFSQAEIVDSAFSEPFGIVYTAVFSPDGRFLAAGTNEGIIYIWRTADQQLAQTIQGHTQPIDQLAFQERDLATGGRELLLASAGNDGRMGMWSLSPDEAAVQHAYLSDPVHGRLISVALNGQFITAVNTEGSVFSWTVAEHNSVPRFIRKFDTMSTRFRLVGCSGDGRLMAIGSRDGIVQIYKCSRNAAQLLATWQVEMKIVASLAMSADGRLLAVGSKSGEIDLWQLSAGGKEQIKSASVQITPAAIDCLAFRADGRRLASTHGVGDQTVRIWSVDSQTGLRLAHTLQGHTHIVWSAAFGRSASAEPLLVTGSSDQTVRVWETTAGHSLYKLHGQPRALSDIAIHPLPLTAGAAEKQNRRWLLAAVGYNHKAHLWRGQGRQVEDEWQTLHRSDGALYAAAICRNGRLLATGGHDRKIYLWEIATGRHRHTFHGHTNNVIHLDFHPQSDLLISGGADSTVRLWRVADGEAWKEVATIQAHPRILYRVAISADGRLLATAGSDLTLRFWDLTQSDYPELTSLQKSVVEPSERHLESVAFSPDGAQVAVGGNRTIHLWDADADQPNHVLHQHTLSIHSVAFSPDGELLASGSEDSLVCLWQTATGALIHKLAGHSETIYKVTFTPDGALLLSCSADGQIKFWDVQTGTCIHTLRVEAPYAGMKINGVKGISDTQKSALNLLGATGL